MTGPRTIQSMASVGCTTKMTQKYSNVICVSLVFVILVLIAKVDYMLLYIDLDTMQLHETTKI